MCMENIFKKIILNRATGDYWLFIYSTEFGSDSCSIE